MKINLEIHQVNVNGFLATRKIWSFVRYRARGSSGLIIAFDDDILISKKCNFDRLNKIFNITRYIRL